MFIRLWQERQRRRKREAAMLAWARQEILAAAPFGYGHFQGEDGYRIWDERLDPGFVAFASTAEGAEVWIIEQFLQEADSRKPESKNSTETLPE
ncbi:MAG: hypothetical protein KF753_03500 [Caldilineaceae bacterium]|nr:hypothetical protein [Caldilineaceae bacterium]